MIASVATESIIRQSIKQAIKPDVSATALVIGYGSPIRGDDAIGPLVADRLQQLTLPDWVQVEARHILTAELAADMAHMSQVIFLDAAVDLPPGELRCQPLLPDASALSTMAHFHDPRELLAWCQGLYGRVPKAWLITAGGAEFDYGHFHLSEAATHAVPSMIQTVMDLLGLRHTKGPVGNHTPLGQ
ncbi:hydrogenase maturation protease [Thiorhodovibrio frisius]|uniref:Hydrogenase maturation protease n=1 Tax=Thiorhodovibrio frisius TaxID=631362 RepID=H8Z5J9_9GAMM|nr:hydrogenase maturation protease [Thiorhodovibrio frisius]WPL21317.1 hydrogenase 3 maturation protease [Thiorhodovibrio frisius]